MAQYNKKKSAELQSLQNETRFLFDLLDDDDEQVALAVVNKLIEKGGGVASELRSLMADSPSAIVRRNAERALRALQKNALDDLQALICEAIIEDRDPELEQSVILLSKFGYPETNVQRINNSLNQIALSVHEKFIDSYSHNELGHILAMNGVFFNEYGFIGAGKEYYDPDCSYFHTVLEKKKGIPIALSIVYLLVAERSGLDVYGVNMPMHFLLRDSALDIYIDVFNGGALISRSECRAFLEKSEADFKENMLDRADNISIILRMIRNLSYAHGRYGDIWEASALARFHARLIGK